MNRYYSRFIALFLLLLICRFLFSQIIVLDEFESTEGWNFIKSDGVELKLDIEQGLTGKAIRFDYDFTKGTGYGGVQKFFPIDLPENYEFTFYLKAQSPENNFEIKFIDESGDNVWWVNNRNYKFPEEWKKIRIKKRHIDFAWGPASDRNLKRIDRIEFTIASFVGGKGTIWLDDLKFEPLPAEIKAYPQPSVNTSSLLKKNTANNILDRSAETYWFSKDSGNQTVNIDFKMSREFGGLQIRWLEDHFAKDFDVFLSGDARDWEKAYSVRNNQTDVSFIRLPEAQARFLRLELINFSSEKGYGIREIEFLEVLESLTPNDFFRYVAKNSALGYYPRYFTEQASFWTISGVNNDVSEALINEDGMIEANKASFSIEPMIRVNNKLYNWNNVQPSQSLGFNGRHENFTFLPTVQWLCEGIKLSVSVASIGEANKNSMLDIRYTLENRNTEPIEFDLFLIIRPFQVNPYYQFLNLPGGVGKINSISEDNGVIAVNDKVIIPQRKYDAFGAVNFDNGNIADLLSKGFMPDKTLVTDEHGLVSGVIKYSLNLNPGGIKEFYMLIPFYEEAFIDQNSDPDAASVEFNKSADFWRSKVDKIRFNLPSSADRIINTYKANLIYILINRDLAGIQPGSRSYERSWIRDGALTSSALLKSGIIDEVRDFINWYAPHQYENGKVPCVVDFRGPDPVPENDSHGQLIYLIREYFNFTKDTAFLRSKNKHVLMAADYIASLVAERSVDHFKYGNDSVRAYYGLVPESISHEGYSEKPMHSYWDNFFTIKGLKDAAEIQKILGETENYERIKMLKDTFEVNLYNSIRAAMKIRGIDYIPGCVELGDFDATSTTVALTPCNELKNLPKLQIYNTFDKYYEYFEDRRDNKIEWRDYTPYENRLIGSFIILDQPDRAHELLEFLLDDQRPQGWYHWAEIVWKDYRAPRFIGDMPHTWVGSDFINAFRTMFVYENEYDQSLVLAPAIYQDWIDSPEGMSVEDLPTYFGEISYSIKKEYDFYRFSVSGDVKLPANGIKIKNFNSSKLPLKVMINSKETMHFTNNEIMVNEIPAELLIYY